LTGGDEDPCIRRSEIPAWEKEFGRPCPRVELDSSSELSGVLALKFADRIQLGESSYGGVYDAAISGLVTALSIRTGFKDTNDVLDQAFRALGSEDVVTCLNNRIRRARKKAAERGD
jgi:hypothetical protein